MAKYKAGDKVRVKSWDKLVEEFGVDEDGDVNTAPCVIKRMKEYCGQVVTIKKVNDFNGYYELSDIPCYWSDDMFEEKVEQMILFCPDLVGRETVKLFSAGSGDFVKPVLNACVKEKCVAYKDGKCMKYGNKAEIEVE